MRRTSPTLLPMSRLEHRAVFERSMLARIRAKPALRMRWPCCGERAVDLYFFYQLVLAHGGYAKFAAAAMWPLYLKAHGMMPTDVGAADRSAVTHGVPSTQSLPALTASLDEIYKVTLPVERLYRQLLRKNKEAASAAAFNQA